jgi:hypothetical protein
MCNSQWQGDTLYDHLITAPRLCKDPTLWMIRQSHVAWLGLSPGEVKENYPSLLLLAASCSRVLTPRSSKPCRLEFWPKQGSNPAETNHFTPK